ncbi:POP1 [Branchiostoma lanceolatum]|uniref:POP1 protein n=2 Tax=Branchiostoma lanceolatum TaxID=7740 RepID=A0A8K0EV40_BRALA|nr:POP1 [Branchiostoma lanceolatum]
MSSPYKDETPGSLPGIGQQSVGRGLSRRQKFRRKHVGPPVPSHVPSPAAATPGTGATPGVTMAPRGLTVMQFMEARAVELNSLLHSAQQMHGPRHTLQSLPRHMRRRAVSHNPKRLPRRLREVGTRKMLQNLQPGQQLEKSRRPRKFYRRRAANRQESFSQRQNHVSWLHTHVWHAKRFHMVNSWGYRLPDHPCDKSVRAAYRAMCHHCLIQDISYYGCIELTGSQGNILRLLQHFTPQDTGGFGSLSSSEGRVEGTATLYRRDCFPRCALGPVTYVFRALTENSQDHSTASSRQLWLWTHPAITQDVLQELQQMSHTGVCVQSIGHELVRFRLTGQLAAATLEAALHLPPLQNETVQPGQVLSLTVVDPRLNMPSKRTKVTPLTTAADPVELKCDAVLWDADKRKMLQTPPGQNNRSGEEDTDVAGDDGSVAGDNRRVPILLVHQQGRTAQWGVTPASALGTGWDVILPAGWAMVFWLGLQYRGARAGGLREMRRLQLETGQLVFPDDFPDTEAYRTLHQDQAARRREQHDRYPPGKRPNFAKLGTAAPFHCPWDRLVEGWAQLAGTPSTGKPRGTRLAGTPSPGQPRGLCVARDSRIRQQLSQLCRHADQQLGRHADRPELVPVLSHLVVVRLRMVSRGTPVAMAMICAPSEEDVAGGVASSPVEPAHPEGMISDDCDVVRHCSRLTLGYVTAGANSLAAGQGSGVGLCVVQGLLSALQVQQQGQAVVLVRNPNSAQYRFAHVTVL